MLNNTSGSDSSGINSYTINENSNDTSNDNTNNNTNNKSNQLNFIANKLKLKNKNHSSLIW